MSRSYQSLVDVFRQASATQHRRADLERVDRFAGSAERGVRIVVESHVGGALGLFEPVVHAFLVHV